MYMYKQLHVQSLRILLLIFVVSCELSPCTNYCYDLQVGCKLRLLRMFSHIVELYFLDHPRTKAAYSPQDCQSYSRRSPGLRLSAFSRRNNQLPSPSGTGQASAPIRCLTTLRRPVFLVNSRLGLVTATFPERGSGKVPLLPKLRGHFAEFLRESCLAPLGILYPPTCVSFGYRSFLFIDSSSFSWKLDGWLSCPLGGRPYHVSAQRSFFFDLE